VSTNSIETSAGPTVARCPEGGQIEVDAAQKLLGWRSRSDPFDYLPEDVSDLQLQAAAERLEQDRERVVALDRRADEAGVKQIDGMEDLVPLLFSHATYQSYPDSILRQRKWGLLANWLSAHSAVEDAFPHDFSNVADIDEWMRALRDSGHYVFSSSGSEGKPALFDQSQADLDRLCELVAESMQWSSGAEPDRSRAAFMLFPHNSSHNYSTVYNRLAERFGRSDATFWLSDEEMLVKDTMRISELRHAIGTGKARPSEVTAASKRQAERVENVDESFERLVEGFAAHHDEPCMIVGPWGVHWKLVQRLQALGVQGLAEGSVVEAGGSLKGAAGYPDDFQQQIAATYGVPLERFWKSYGMAEVPSHHPRCSEGRYHTPPWVIPIVVDRQGSELIQEVQGRRSGRFGLLDLATEGRWCGFLSGDNVDMTSSPCGCGRRGPTILGISPLVDLAASDDKLSCAGTVDAYVRGIGE
jgi:hypothetical protein